jgi:hypothetical protein
MRRDENIDLETKELMSILWACGDLAGRPEYRNRVMATVKYAFEKMSGPNSVPTMDGMN